MGLVLFRENPGFYSLFRPKIPLLPSKCFILLLYDWDADNLLALNAGCFVPLAILLPHLLTDICPITLSLSPHSLFLPPSPPYLYPSLPFIDGHLSHYALPLLPFSLSLSLPPYLSPYHKFIY